MTEGRSIEVPSTQACAFCAYLAGERPYAIAVQGDTVAALVTQEARGYPHLLVVPVRHCETLLDLTDEEARQVMIATREVARIIDSKYQRPGIAVWQNNGVAAHQAVGHVHVHVAGTLDGGGTEWGPVEETSLEDAEGIAKVFRPHLEQALRRL